MHPVTKTARAWLRKHPYWAGLLAVVSVVLISLPQWAEAVWALFSSRPLVPTLIDKANAIGASDFSAYWITTPLGLLILTAIFYLLVTGRRSSREVEISQNEIDRSIFSYSGAMLDRLSSEHRINFFIRVFNGLPYPISIPENFDGFILLRGKPLPRPEIGVWNYPAERMSSISVVQEVDEDMAKSMQDSLDKGERLNFDFRSLHVQVIVEGKEYRLKLPGGLGCENGVRYIESEPLSVTITV